MKLSRLCRRTRLALLCACALSASAGAQIIDPEAQIKKNGHYSVRMGDDGVTRFYTLTERVSAARIEQLERGIAALPKQKEIFQLCDQTRGAVKAKLIAESGVAYDVAATNYGYTGSTIACVLKYMHAEKVGTQLMYLKKASGSMYMVFVTN